MPVLSTLLLWQATRNNNKCNMLQQPVQIIRACK